MFLVAYGAAVGRGPHILRGDAEHGPSALPVKPQSVADNRLEDILSGRRKPEVEVTEHDALVEGVYLPMTDDLAVTDTSCSPGTCRRGPVASRTALPTLNGVRTAGLHVVG
jgi:hypothetical protein